MNKKLLATGALLSALSVGLGAFAAHALKERLDAYSLGIFETAVKYQFYHCFAILITAILTAFFSSKKLRLAGIFFFAGIILFSGSLYVLALNPQMKVLGAVTPFGGLCFITGWVLIALTAFENKHNITQRQN